MVLPVFVAAAFGLDAWNELRKAHLVEAFRVPSASMEPTVLVGDYIIVDRRRAARAPERGAVLVHESVEEPGLKVLKRAVALSGDTIEMRQGRFRLNGRPVDEPYLAPAGETNFADPAQRQEMRAWQLPHLLGGSDSLYLPDVNDWGPLVVPGDRISPSATTATVPTTVATTASSPSRKFSGGRVMSI